jgi:hypothetical protein
VDDDTSGSAHVAVGIEQGTKEFLTGSRNNATNRFERWRRLLRRHRILCKVQITPSHSFASIENECGTFTKKREITE